MKFNDDKGFFWETPHRELKRNGGTPRIELLRRQLAQMSFSATYDPPPLVAPPPKAVVALDLETDDPDLRVRGSSSAFAGRGKICGVSVAWQGFAAYYPIAHREGNVDSGPVLAWLTELALRDDILLVFAKASYDLAWVKRELNRYPASRCIDIQHMAALLDEYRSGYGLDAIAHDYLGKGKDTSELDELERELGCKHSDLMSCMALLSGPIVARYAVTDAVRTLECYDAMIPRIAAEGLDKVHLLESDLIPLMTEMRLRGVRIDIPKVEQVGASLITRMSDVKDELERQTGVSVEPWEATTCERALETIGVKCARTASGQPQVDNELLSSVAAKHTVGKLILDLRKMSKIKTTFIDGHFLGHHEKGRVHAEFNQLRSERDEKGIGTVTGRFCIAAGTQVMLPRGTKNVEDVKPGDLVYSFTDDNSLVIKKVIWSGKTGQRPIVRLRWQELGHYHEGYLDITRDHPVRQHDGSYVAVEDLLQAYKVRVTGKHKNKKFRWTGGSSLVSVHRHISEDGRNYLTYPRRYSHSVEELPGLHDVYDIEVEDTHNFIANEICIHNSSHPNMQQIPERDAEWGPLMRSMILPDEGEELASIDYSGQEPKLSAHFAFLAEEHAKKIRRPQSAVEQRLVKIRGAREAVEAYRANPRLSMHKYVADVCWPDTAPHNSSSKRYKQAKMVNLARGYGAGGAKIARSLDLPTEWMLVTRSSGRSKWTKVDAGSVEALREQGSTVVEVAGPEAKATIESIDKGAPFLRGLYDVCEARAQARGYITTLLERRCRFEEDGGGGYRFTYRAMNRLCQSSAADQTKAGMRDLWRAGVVPRLTVHDELVFSVADRGVLRDYAHAMEHVVELEVPTSVDVAVGRSWGEMEDYNVGD